MKILCLGTTPAAQRVMIFSRLTLDQVNRARTTLDGAAGKSINVAKVLRVLGARPVAVGFLGGPRGEQIRAILDQQAVEHDFVTVTAPTRECVTVIDESAGAVTELVEESQPVEADAYGRLLTSVQTHLPGCRAAVMSGTIASGGPTNLYARCTQLAHEVGALAILDASGPPLLQALSTRPALVKPNRAELEKTLGRDLADDQILVQAMRSLQEQGAGRVVITAGAKPTLALHGDRLWRVAAPRVKAFNPIGSGDAFTAALSWRLIAGDDLGEACRWAAAAGAANALTAMAGELTRQEVERLAPEVQVERL